MHTVISLLPFIIASPAVILAARKNLAWVSPNCSEYSDLIIESYREAEETDMSMQFPDMTPVGLGM